MSKSQKPVCFSISVPEEIMGEVMGRMVALGAWLRKCHGNVDGRITFVTDIPDCELPKFSDWLSNSIGAAGATIERFTL